MITASFSLTRLIPSLRNTFFCTPSQIGDHRIINPALQFVCEKQQQEKGKVRNVPGLLITKLQRYKTNGPPTIPAGVDKDLIPPSLDGNISFIDLLSSEAENPNIINAALKDLDHIIRTKGFRGNTLVCSLECIETIKRSSSSPSLME